MCPKGYGRTQLKYCSFWTVFFMDKTFFVTCWTQLFLGRTYGKEYGWTFSTGRAGTDHLIWRAVPARPIKKILPGTSCLSCSMSLLNFFLINFCLFEKLSFEYLSQFGLGLAARSSQELRCTRFFTGPYTGTEPILNGLRRESVYRPDKMTTHSTLRFYILP